MLEEPISWVLLFFLGIFTGVLSGLLGIGGGLLMVPALTVFNVPLVQATATSLVGVLLSSISGSLRNLSAGELNWRVSLALALFGVITAQVGAWLGDRAPDAVLSLAFAVLLLITIYLMTLRQKLKTAEVRRQEPENSNQEAGNTAGISYTGREEVQSKIQNPQIQDSQIQTLQFESTTDSFRLAPIAGIGLLAGLLSGLFGVGGGVVMVPLQMLFLGEPIKAAVRTSLGAIVAIAISGLARHTWNGNVLWIPGLCLGIGGIVGAQVGSRLLPHLAEHTVNLLFKLFLIGLAAYMAIRAIGY